MFSIERWQNEIKNKLEKERENFEKEQNKQLQIKITELKKKIKNIDKNIDDNKYALEQLDECNNDVRTEYCKKIMNWETEKNELINQIEKIELPTWEIIKPNNGFNSI